MHNLFTTRRGGSGLPPLPPRSCYQSTHAKHLHHRTIRLKTRHWIASTKCQHATKTRALTSPPSACVCVGGVGVGGWVRWVGVGRGGQRRAKYLSGSACLCRCRCLARGGSLAPRVISPCLAPSQLPVLLPGELYRAALPRPPSRLQEPPTDLHHAALDGGRERRPLCRAQLPPRDARARRHERAEPDRAQAREWAFRPCTPIVSQPCPALPSATLSVASTRSLWL